MIYHVSINHRIHHLASLSYHFGPISGSKKKVPLSARAQLAPSEVTLVSSCSSPAPAPEAADPTVIQPGGPAAQRLTKQMEVMSDAVKTSKGWTRFDLVPIFGFDLSVFFPFCWVAIDCFRKRSPVFFLGETPVRWVQGFE